MGTHAANTPVSPTIIFNKTVLYQRGIYADIHFRFSEVLRK